MFRKLKLSVALLAFYVAPLAAETRGVLIVTRRGPARELQVTIHSDEKDDRTDKTSLEFAVKKIAKMESWGSRVYVCVVDEESMEPRERKTLFEAIEKNVNLSLTSYGPEAPKNVAAHFKVPARPGPDVNSYRWQDPLTYLLASSDLVVAGEIVAEPPGLSTEAGIVHYSVEFKISQLLKGKEVGERKVGGTITFTTVQLEMEKGDHNPLLAKGSKCIVFLKTNDRQETPTYSAVESYLSLQRESKSLIHALTK